MVFAAECFRGFESGGREQGCDGCGCGVADEVSAFIALRWPARLLTGWMATPDTKTEQAGTKLRRCPPLQ